jgi:hypothetical protein
MSEVGLTVTLATTACGAVVPVLVAELPWWSVHAAIETTANSQKPGKLRLFMSSPCNGTPNALYAFARLTYVLSHPAKAHSMAEVAQEVDRGSTVD